MFLKLFGEKKELFAEQNIDQVVKLACVVNHHIKGKLLAYFKGKIFNNIKFTELAAYDN